MAFTKHIILLLFSALLTACDSCEWTTEETIKFNDECPKQKSVENLIVDFRGFDNSDFDSVLIHEYEDTLLINAFKIKVDMSSSQDEIINKSRRCIIDRKLFTNHSYKFIVDSINTYLLKDMKMIVWPQVPSCPDCTMGDYTIDTVSFIHNGNLSFTKKIR